jgi:hypothetical protein
MAVNPVIEINKEGTRARGLWHSPGILTSRIEGKLVAQWYYGKYVMEYAKEDGQWKFLKLKWNPIFITPYDGKGWVEGKFNRVRSTPLPKSEQPTSPGFNNPYDPEKIITFGPPPHEPYED